MNHFKGKDSSFGDIKIDNSKAAPVDNIPVHILIKYIDLFADILQNSFNRFLGNWCFCNKHLWILHWLMKQGADQVDSIVACSAVSTLFKTI